MEAEESTDVTVEGKQGNTSSGKECMTEEILPVETVVTEVAHTQHSCTDIAIDEDEYVLQTIPPRDYRMVPTLTGTRVADLKKVSSREGVSEVASEELYELPDAYRHMTRDLEDSTWKRPGEIESVRSGEVDEIMSGQDNSWEKALKPKKKFELKFRYQTKNIIPILSISVAGLAMLFTVVLFSVAISVDMSSIDEEIGNISRQEQKISELNHKITALTRYVINPTNSCKNIDTPPGEYWIVNSMGEPAQVYCDAKPRLCSCNTTGGWMRVASLNMTDPDQNCPRGLQLVSRMAPPMRTCGRPGNRYTGCASVLFGTQKVEYSRVCGRVIGYQFGVPEAFDPYITDRGSIDTDYIDGISLTHGRSPRQHIWTFAAALDENNILGNRYTCPCIDPTISFEHPLPPFVDSSYFCDTATQDRSFEFYPDDPLWDGEGCGGTSTCCEFNNPPWFCKELPQPSTDDIELRLCGSQETSDMDAPIEIVDIWVQ